MENVVIIGTGSAGWTAALYTSRANLNPRVLAGEQPGGLLTTTSEVENFPGFPEGIDGYELMTRMQQQAEKFGARTEYKVAETVTKTEAGHFEIKIKGSDEVIEAKTVIAATGASPRLLGLEGEQELYGKAGVTTCATCDGAFYRDMPVVVVGGGDSAAEEAHFLTRFASKVYLVHRRDELRASKIMAERVLAHEKIEPVWHSELTGYLPGENNKLAGVTVKNNQTGEESTLDVRGAFIAIGHVPNSSFLGDLVDRNEAGYIQTQGERTATKTPGLFSAGDVMDDYYRQAITAAGEGCKAAIEAERYLAEED
ncbi:MAG: thioredoxin-disulfide reductase [Verrucomicrobiota bacterium JB023]|nr:thioredoxin-disulfide reductase [Verrucomicrobiota bacterium JB023]